MSNYLSKNLDYLKSDITNACDELSLWSSLFGILLLDNFHIKKFNNYLDIGCGTGFPLIEIASMIGADCQAIGIDPWSEAVKRAKIKIEALQYDNISIIDGNAENLNFKDNYFDLITSNLGINNFENPDSVINECYRVLKSEGTFCLTTNLTGTFGEFYKLFQESLIDLKFEKYLTKLYDHINHRETERSTIDLLENNGFKIKNIVRSKCQMRYYDGSAFLNHPYIIIGFINSWRNILENEDKQVFFENFEKRLNTFANQHGELKLTTSMLYIEAYKG